MREIERFLTLDDTFDLLLDTNDFASKIIFHVIEVEFFRILYFDKVKSLFSINFITYIIHITT